jgi:cytochrome P450
MLPPGPDVPFVTTWQWIKRPFSFLEECARRYGDPFTMRLAAIPDPLVVFSNPEAVKEIFADDGSGMHAERSAKGSRFFSASRA